MHISRRDFLRVGAAGVAGAGLGMIRLRPAAADAAAGATQAATAAAAPVYGDWRDVYRQRWAWDKIVRSSHFVNCWYQAHCSFNVYLKDGVVWREEQAADYPQVRPDVPDFNPRGCQKGACFSERMYDPSRVSHPLKRVGERGSGKWQRIPWDQALTEIADSVIDTVSGEGSDRVIWELGPLYTAGVMAAAQQRIGVLLDSTTLDMNTEIGDGHRGVGETFGKIVFERSADDYFFSDLILIWGGNPICTQIPNAHFLLEARYHGTNIVCISPDYSASAVHADLWVPVELGCDAALGLSLAHVLVEEGLVDRDFVTEQTDLPFLIRDDTRRYLRGADLDDGGDEDELFVYDQTRGVVAAPRQSLELSGLQPVLDGRFEATLADGTKVPVRTVFSLLRERLKDYAPEKATKLCGTPPGLIRNLARRIGTAKAVSMTTTSNFSKHYHGNLIERTQALVFALSGNYGKKGSGFVGFPFLVNDGLERMALSLFPLTERLQLIAGALFKHQKHRWAGLTEEMAIYERGREANQSGMFACGALFWYVHAGLLNASDDLQDWDPYLKRPVREVLDESLKNGWQYVWPKPGDDPRVMFVYGSNPLRRIRCYPLVLEHLWPKLRTIVTLDFRMTSTAMHSDYVLPVAAWYERTEHKWVTPLMPFAHAGAKMTTYYEAKSDWEILARLAMTVQKRANERGIATYTDRRGNTRRLHDVGDRFTAGGTFGPEDDDKVARAIHEASSTFDGVTWEELRDRGWARYTDIGHSAASVGNATEIRPDDTITPLTRHVYGKIPYPTLSRRQQYYIDQELYLEMGEELPTHKQPPIAGGRYPLVLSGGHTRWSIHAAWRDDRLMLRQQRGVPVMYISAADADARGIFDGMRVRVWNDIAEFQVMAKVSPALRPGQLIVYHAWENYQFQDGKGFQNLIPSPLNPVELAGGQFHLRPMVICMQPSHTDRDTRVEVARI
ncbi:molybdopterin-dependent oxidoreductase [Candidatus Binatia bacterium]|nr:molybdopterin-dependent oxidoreductase [Candidatus Binatia bacterium]